MKILTVVIVTLLVGGGGTAVAVATVGNVDWDQWHLFGNHHEEYNVNPSGIKFSVIHTDPEYNEADGQYYAVTKLQCYDVEGKMILFKEETNQGTKFVQTEDGVLVTVWTGNNGLREITILLPKAQLETLKVKTHPDINSDESYHKELCDKYGIPYDKHLSVRHYREGNGPDYMLLITQNNSEETVWEENFEYKMVDRTVTAAILTDGGLLEIQHIEPTVDDCLKSIYDYEDSFNKLMGDDCIRMVEYATAV